MSIIQKTKFKEIASNTKKKVKEFQLYLKSAIIPTQEYKTKECVAIFYRHVFTTHYISATS